VYGNTVRSDPQVLNFHRVSASRRGISCIMQTELKPASWFTLCSSVPPVVKDFRSRVASSVAINIDALRVKSISS
jgi:hypothetical protein